MTYSTFVVDSPNALTHWIESFGDATLFALIDFQSLNLDELRKIELEYRPVASLYNDLEGTAIADSGPRLVEIGDESRSAMLRQLIAGFPAALLMGQCGFSELESHLREIREVRVPEDTYALFRYQDMRVLRALFPLLSQPQIQQILGPLSGWGVVDCCGQFHGLSLAVVRDKKPGALQFTKQQISLLDEALFVHTVFAQIRDTDSALLDGLTPCEVETKIRTGLAHGKSLGLDQRSDLSLYCVLSFQFPVEFEGLSPFKEALRYRESGIESFGSSLDGVAPAVWDQWDQRLHKVAS